MQEMQEVQDREEKPEFKEPISKEKIRWQCRRGMLELDLILGRFFEKQFDNQSESNRTLFVELLKEADQTLYRWLIDISCANYVTSNDDSEIEIKHNKFAPILNQIRSFK